MPYSLLSLQRWEIVHLMVLTLVAPWVTVQVLLVHQLGRPEVGRRYDLGDDAALVPLLVGFSRDLSRDFLLLFVVEEYRAPVLRPHIDTLLVLSRRVVRVVEELDDLCVGDSRRVVVHCYGFGVYRCWVFMLVDQFGTLSEPYATYAPSSPCRPRGRSGFLCDLR